MTSAVCRASPRLADDADCAGGGCVAAHVLAIPFWNMKSGPYGRFGWHL